MATALAGRHAQWPRDEVGVPVIGGGRALPTEVRAARLGLDALARFPRDAWTSCGPGSSHTPIVSSSRRHPIPDTNVPARRCHALIATVMRASANGEAAGMALAEELHRVVQVVEGALLLGESDLIDEQVDWLHHTGAAHGFSRRSTPRRWR